MWDTVDQTTHPDDHANAIAIFGEVKKYILSKKFRFGSPMCAEQPCLILARRIFKAPW